MALRKSSLHNKNEIDATGKKHIFYVQNEKYQSLRRRNRGTKNIHKNCNQSNQYIETLEKRIEQILNEVNQLENTTATGKNQSSNLTRNDYIVSPDFSQMNTDVLINIATHLNSTLYFIPEQFMFANYLNSKFIH
ncbi:7312_t:CDS:2 [Ambispora gerdemannii]|uniref:7312_t:CDS:1 n=1 Tax=Ambispora gerdemannii TaxID=144530 RepID=A0A9N9E3W1_9GLOM|nr:7312_t:CDS:2 [Ambispora gerdemannii]